MIKEREKLLIKTLLDLWEKNPLGGFAIDTIKDDKQLHYYLQKWSDKGWWEYGITLRGGWFTEEGLNHFKFIKEKELGLK